METPAHKIVCGDALVLMRKAAGSAKEAFSAIVTDPPYNLSFMGKDWDRIGGPQEYQQWSQEWAVAAMALLRPGGHMLVMGGTRTWHRMACGLEDAGFELRDCLMWLYGTGFPKSLDVSKAIDKAAGVERPVIGHRKLGGSSSQYAQDAWSQRAREEGFGLTSDDAETDDARRWRGWGTALKPAWEPILLARKPLSEPTVAANVLKWGTGGLDIDACRLKVLPRKTGSKPGSNDPTGTGASMMGSSHNRQAEYDTENKGRWPANLLLDEEAAGMLDAATGNLGKSSGGRVRSGTTGESGVYGRDKRIEVGDPGYGDTGGASRFFYVAKASRAEREHGLDGAKNPHPTVKPVALMRYLVRLITPPEGRVLDPFVGSGTTLLACKLEGFPATGIDINPEYCESTKKRLEAVLGGSN